MSAPTSGLARVTIRTPRRRLDLAVPGQVPIVELLPELLYRAGEEREARLSGGWILRRGAGESLTADYGLADQGVRDGDVLYLVPRDLSWPEPTYDDVIEEVAVAARGRGRAWDAAATRLGALVAAGVLVLLAGLELITGLGGPPIVSGLVAVVIAVSLVATGAMFSRALGDGVVGAATGGFALPFAAVAGLLVVAGPGATGVGPGQVLVGSGALLLASAAGAVAVGRGLRIFVAGATVALLGLVGGVVGSLVPGAAAAAVVLVVALIGIAVAAPIAVRAGGLPVPAVTAAPEVIAAEPRPTRAAVVAATGRADDVMTGILLGVAAAATVGVGLLTADGGVAGSVTAGLASVALLLRARQFPAFSARVPLLSAGLVGATLATLAGAGAAGPVARGVGLVGALVALAVLLGTAAAVTRRPGTTSPYLGRMAEILDVVVLLALVPAAFQVLHLFSLVRGLVG